ncbi:MAG: copper resistance protein B [Proteobacteria bacterium]|nr:copper resistance protein B [Pseudomonadota bacterium]
MRAALLPLAAGLATFTAGASCAQTVPVAGTHAALPDAAMMPPVMDNPITVHGILDQAEGRIGGGQNAFRWEGQAWIGTDYNKLWLKSEGFALGKGGVDDGRLEVLYSRAVSTYLDVQAGVRTDLDSGTGRTWAALGVQGLAPLFFDYEITGYLSDQGHAALRVALSYDLLITQRLILQPEVEMNVYSKADPGRHIGAGLSDIDAGLRLRYEISRKFAPYIGVAYAGRIGQSARLAGQQGDPAAAVQFVFGIRSWF